MKIWYLIASNGDGSSKVNFYQTEQGLQQLVDSDAETYGCNENGPQSFDVNADGTTTIQFSNVPELA